MSCGNWPLCAATPSSHELQNHEVQSPHRACSASTSRKTQSAGCHFRCGLSWTADVARVGAAAQLLSQGRILVSVVVLQQEKAMWI